VRLGFLSLDPTKDRGQGRAAALLLVLFFSPDISNTSDGAIGRS
jgi:hypothetical protein